MSEGQLLCSCYPEISQKQPGFCMYLEKRICTAVRAKGNVDAKELYLVSVNRLRYKAD